MIYHISAKEKLVRTDIHLSSSKSISNRLLIIKHIGNLLLQIQNLSGAEDTKVLHQSILELNTLNQFDTGHAGTSYRFLTALFAATPGERILTGSSRMKQRPIGILVDCLRKLGADITYLENESYPPLKIRGKQLSGGKLGIDGSVSSQYISSLMLISPLLSSPLNIELEGAIVSEPYIDMTIELMKYFGAEIKRRKNKISCNNKPYSALSKEFIVEADWSSASYWYSIAALSETGSEIILKGLQKNSLQADSVCSELFQHFGVTSEFTDTQTLLLRKIKSQPIDFEYDFTNCPDIAQSITIVAAGLGIKAKLKGLSTLKIKETDRIAALKTELKKIGVETATTEDSIEIYPAHLPEFPTGAIETYNDHRMAMAFAPLALVMKSIEICNPDVVEKSYPQFWKDLESAAFSIKPSFSA